MARAVSAMVRGPVGAAAGEHRDRDPAAVGHGDEADVVGEPLSVPVLCSTGVPNGSSAADAVLAGLALGHQVEQIVAARRAGSARRGRCACSSSTIASGVLELRAVPQVALVGEQLGDVAVDAQARGAVLDAASRGAPRGPPRSREQHVGRAIVAVDHHPRHQAARRHAVDRVVERAAAMSTCDR